MLNIELVRFEAQDVITASGVVEAPTHEHHWSLMGGQAVGMADNKAKIDCQEPGCNSSLIIDQPVGLSYTW